MFTQKLRQLSVSVLSYFIFACCFVGRNNVDSAPIDFSTPANLLNTQPDQHLDQQNQTEAEPDLSQQQPELQESAPATNSSHTGEKLHAFSAIDFVKDRFGRQDVGQAVGDRVGTIISGVLGGGLGNIFQGSTSFIGNVNAAEEVDFVLNNVGPPVEAILKYGYEGLKQYLGIGQTTVKTETQTILVTQPPEQKVYLQPVVHENGTVEYIPIYHTVTKPPLVVSFTVPAVEEEGELGDIDSKTYENKDSDYDIIEKYPLLVNSRVDRLH